MKELYPGEYADLLEWAQGECDAAAAAEAHEATLTPGTPEYEAARVDSYYHALGAGHALWELEQFEQRNGLPLTPVERFLPAEAHHA